MPRIVNFINPKTLLLLLVLMAENSFIAFLFYLKNSNNFKSTAVQIGKTHNVLMENPIN